MVAIRSALILVAMMASVPIASADPLPLVPRPESVVPHDGTFVLTAGTVIVSSDAAEGARLAEALRPATGLPLPVVAEATGPAIRMRRGAMKDFEPDGSYTLDVTPAGVMIHTVTDGGLFYGGQTLRQLLPLQCFSPTKVYRVAWTIPCVHIEDRPRFPWRGMHLDCSRHFFDVAFVERFIDLLAMHKMNVFHWHLTDDQGWRLEIKKYPRLTDVGSHRAGSWAYDPGHPDKLRFDATPYGGFYTQDQVRAVVAYAAARHVTVVPEIEMPGHSAAAIAAYPWLGVGGKPIAVRTAYGVEDHVLDPSPRTVGFYHDVLDEVMALFPWTYIHCGGDECPKAEWDHSPEIQARMTSLGLKDGHAMQAWFMGRMDTYLSAHGRRMIGWDEILDGGLTPGAAVMSWRGEAGAVAAVKQGHEAVNASNGYLYFDYYQSADHAHEPHAIGGLIPLSKVYGFDPVPAGLTGGGRVLGAQGQLWSEYLPAPANVEYMAFPRACALAERVWSPAAGSDFADFRRRLAAHLQRLKAMGVNYRPLDPG